MNIEVKSCNTCPFQVKDNEQAYCRLVSFRERRVDNFIYCAEGDAVPFNCPLLLGGINIELIGAFKIEY